MSNSPFKFLNAFEKKDVSLFFGREQETEDVYEMTFDTQLILLYGASGTGKTSLIQCGLANKFSETRWKDIFVRRDDNIMQTLSDVLDSELIKLGVTAEQAPDTFTEKINQINRRIFKPVFLIFDQFEELFIVNPDKEEQTKFFESLKAILDSRVDCKVILVMREEFLAHLWNYEKIIDSLFQHHYRIEKMRSSNLMEVIQNTLEKLSEKGALAYTDAEDVAEQILEQLRKGRSGLELTYLQVYLDRLYQEAQKENELQPRFSTDLVEKVGRFEDIVSQFIDDQINELEVKLGTEKKGIPLKILGAMITNERTKRVLSDENLEEIRERLGLNEEEFNFCIATFEKMRIIKRYD